MSVCLKTVDDTSLPGCPSYFYSPRSKIKEVVLWGSCLEWWPPGRLGNQARAPPSAYQSGVKLKVLPLMLPALPEKQVRSSSNQMEPKQSKSLDTEALWGPQICVSLCVSTCELLVALGLCVCACVRMAMGEVFMSVCLCMPNKTSPAWDFPWVRPNAGPPHASPCVALVQSYGKDVIVPILQNWGLWLKLIY